jgi:thiaminase/transcriptional activator TenA
MNDTSNRLLRSPASSGVRAFSAEVFEEVQPILARIYEHPFNAELAQGTLSKERFCVYMQQDSLYLVQFSRALAIAGSRAVREKHIETLLVSAQNALLAERSLHEHYFSEYGVSRDTKENPTCMSYTSLLLATASLKSLGEALAALLPCFWIYREVGSHISRIAASPNPYSKWIETYSDEGFSAAVDNFIELVDTAAAESTEQTRLRMREFFMTASHLEYYFWDDAYHMRILDCTR